MTTANHTAATQFTAIGDFPVDSGTIVIGGLDCHAPGLTSLLTPERVEAAAFDPSLAGGQIDERTVAQATATGDGYYGVYGVDHTYAQWPDTGPITVGLWIDFRAFGYIDEPVSPTTKYEHFYIGEIVPPFGLIFIGDPCYHYDAADRLWPDLRAAVLDVIDEGGEVDGPAPGVVYPWIDEPVPVYRVQGVDDSTGRQVIAGLFIDLDYGKFRLPDGAWNAIDNS